MDRTCDEERYMFLYKDGKNTPVGRLLVHGRHERSGGVTLVEFCDFDGEGIRCKDPSEITPHFLTPEDTIRWLEEKGINRSQYDVPYDIVITTGEICLVEGRPNETLRHIINRYGTLYMEYLERMNEKIDEEKFREIIESISEQE